MRLHAPRRRVDLSGGSVAIVLAVALLISAPLSAAEEVLSPAAARADIRFFARFLEDTHPDPYTPFGGRVAFQSEIQEMLDRVPEQEPSVELVYDLIRKFLGRMNDGHSYVLSPSRRTGDSPSMHLPVRFKVAFDEVFVVEAKGRYSKLIGSRIRSVGGHDLKDLRAAARSVFPRENDFAAAAYAVRLLGSDEQARRMLPDIGDHLRMRMAGIDGREVEVVIPYSLSREEALEDDWARSKWEGVPESTSPLVSAIWVDRSTAYFGLRSIMAREAFEIMRASGRKDLEEHLARFYEGRLHQQKPANVDEAIRETPSICQASHALLSSMKAHDVENLVIDLRGNGGGWSEIMKPLYYMLHGDRYFEGDPVRYATRFSEGYLRILGTDLASYNEKRGTRYELGDLRLSGGVEIEDPVAARSEWLAGLEKSSPDCYELLKGLRGEPLYEPRVYVVTDPGTFSAAYDAAYQFWRLGAQTVGVPPSQASHSFVEGTPFVLPATSLEGAISRTAVTYPDLPENEGAFLLDHAATWNTFLRYEFDVETEILFTLDLIRSGPGSFPKISDDSQPE